jgi:hypothetical protein
MTHYSYMRVSGMDTKVKAIYSSYLAGEDGMI